MSRLFLLILFSFVIANRIDAQISNNSEIDSSWASIQFEEVSAKGKSVKSIADYKGKLVVLDFWNIWCPNCISAMPELDALQKEFAEDIKILCVTSDSETIVTNLFNRTGKSFDNLSFVMGDSLLAQSFPHRSVPHHVWIDRRGNVIYSTYGYNLNKRNIETVLNGTKLDVLTKLDVSFDRNVPLPLNEEVFAKGEYMFFLDSIITGAPRNFETLKKDSNSILFRGINISPMSWIRNVLQMRFYNQFFGGRYAVADNLLSFSPDCSALFTQDTIDVDKWKKRYIRSYERKSKMISFSDFGELLLKDFLTYYHVDASWEPVKMKAWHFRKDLDYSTDNRRPNGLQGYRLMENKVLFTGASVGDFIRCLVLSGADQGNIIVDSQEDDIAIHGEISFEQLFSWKDIVAFLSTQGLILEETVIDTEKLTIRQKEQVSFAYTNSKVSDQ